MNKIKSMPHVQIFCVAVYLIFVLSLLPLLLIFAGFFSYIFKLDLITVSYKNINWITQSIYLIVVLGILISNWGIARSKKSAFLFFPLFLIAYIFLSLLFAVTHWNQVDPLSILGLIFYLIMCVAFLFYYLIKIKKPPQNNRITDNTNNRHLLKQS